MLRTNFFDHAPQKPKAHGLGLSGKDISKKQESRVATRVDGRTVPASGALPFAKGDVCAKFHLLECKTTGKKSLRVERDWLVKIAREAGMKQRDPGLVVSFPGVPSDVDQDWIMLPVSAFKRLMERP